MLDTLLIILDVIVALSQLRVWSYLMHKTLQHKFQLHHGKTLRFLLFIRWAAPQILKLNNKNNLMGHFDWPIATKKLKLGRLPKMQFLCESRVSPLWLTYMGEKGRTLGKTIWDKVSAIENTLEGHIENLRNITGNPLGISWEHDGNTPKKNLKKNHPHTPTLEI